MTRKTICLFHRQDLDGSASGAIVKKAIQDVVVELVPYDYGDPVDFDSFVGNDVILVDCSMLAEEMRLIQDTSNSLTWIDHHKSAIEKVQEAGLQIPGLQKVGQAGCELTWDYYFTGQQCPYGIRLLGRYDVFDLEYSKEVLPFQYGMRSMADSADPCSGVWEGLLGDPSSADASIQAICKRGAVVYEYQTAQDMEAAKSMSFDVIFPDGTRGVACNGGKGSLFFKEVFDPERHDVMVSFKMRKDGLWRISYYSPDGEDAVDCGKLAEQFGRRGGGHAHAAGSTCKYLPFKRVGATSDKE